MSANSESVIRYKRRWRAKRFAHRSLQRAVQRGSVKPGPCEVCGSAEVIGHHDDYLKRRDVRWLCAEHHRRWHKENGPGKNGDAFVPECTVDTSPKLGSAGADLARFLYSHGNPKLVVARWLGVSESTVRRIISGELHRK